MPSRMNEDESNATAAATMTADAGDDRLGGDDRDGGGAVEEAAMAEDGPGATATASPIAAPRPPPTGDGSSSASGIIDGDGDGDGGSSLEEYDPRVMARYVHYYKTGRDIDIDDPSDDREAASASASASCEQQPPPKKKQKKKKVKRKDIPPEVLETRTAIQMCCRDGDLPRALRTFHGALRNLVRMESHVFYILLNLCEGTFAGRTGAHVGTPSRGDDDPPKNKNKNKNKKGDREEGDDDGNDADTKKADADGEGKSAASAAAATAKKNDLLDVPLERRLHHARHIHSLLDSLDVPLTEPAYTALVRLSSRAGDFERAERYLDEAERVQQCRVKLRTYSGLLRAYCGELDRGEEEDGGGGENASSMADARAVSTPPPTQEGLIKALRVWRRMHDNSGGATNAGGHPNHARLRNEGGGGGTTATTTLFGEGITPKITLTELEHTALMSCATKLKDARVMERVLSDVADSVLVPGAGTVDAILNWFRSDNNRAGDECAAAVTTGSALDHVEPPPREDPLLGSVTNGNGRGWRIYRGCTIDPTTGELTSGPAEDAGGAGDEDASGSGGDRGAGAGRYRLGPVELTDRAWDAMRDMNSSIVLEGNVEGNVSQYQGGGKGKKRPRGGHHGNNGGNGGGDRRKPRRDGEMPDRRLDDDNRSKWRIDAWKRFESFTRTHPPYDVVVDGANVGYYEQNFAGSPKHVDYNQIDWLLRHLLEERRKPPSASASSSPTSSSSSKGGDDDDNKGGGGHPRRVILFLHERHFSQRLAPRWAFPLFRSWDGNDAPYDRLTVYRTPAGMNDDWFWMHAALLNGGKGEGGARHPPVLAVTNDEMRDHHFQMLAQASFLRWRERHRVTFDFGPWNGNSRRRSVYLKYPPVYSRRIQRVSGPDIGGAGEAFVVPLAKRGDTGRFADGLHVAGEDVPEEETYIVIQRVV